MSGAPGAPADGGQGAEGTPPAVSPPATPPENQSPPPAPPPPPAEPPAFHSRFTDPEERGYAENKGWKSESDLLKSYRNLEKLRGVPAERLLTLPENLQDAEAMKPILEKIGFAAPADAKDYGFTDIDGVNKDTAPIYEQLAHKHGVPKPLAQAFMADLVKMEQEANAKLDAKEQEEAAIDRGRFHAKHGLKADEKIEQARRFAATMGFTQEDMEAIELNMGPSRFWEVFAAAGAKLGEGSFVEGDRKPRFDMSPEGAQAEKNRLLSDPDFVKRYTGGQLEAKEKMQRLNLIISQAEQAKGALR